MKKNLVGLVQQIRERELWERDLYRGTTRKGGPLNQEAPETLQEQLVSGATKRFFLSIFESLASLESSQVVLPHNVTISTFIKTAEIFASLASLCVTLWL